MAHVNGTGLSIIGILILLRFVCHLISAELTGFMMDQTKGWLQPPAMEKCQQSRDNRRNEPSGGYALVKRYALSFS